MNEKNKTVVVAMSGGVDSSVCAALLKDSGYKIIGITMKTWGFDDFPVKDSGCCSLEAINNARNVASYLGIPHYTLDFTDKFNETVIKNFIDEYLQGYTPNPCVLCNKTIKWGQLMEKAENLGAAYIATGHYAKLRYKKSTGRYYISISNDNQKDQSYALWQISQKALSKTLLPLGDYNKIEIRKLASNLGLKTANEPDSQEICFVPNNNYRELLEIRIPDLKNKIGEGDIIYNNERIGKHKGYPNYTIGQRRGLNISKGKPLYVSHIVPRENKIIVDTEDGLFSRGFIAENINLMKIDKIHGNIKAKVKIRYKDKGSEAKLEQLSEDKIKVIFTEPKKSITPGQSSVFYEEEDVLGGGIIREIIK